ncbi:hypothetical protein [Mycolicibacterium smegmatis]|jgi:hypothetical protein|uniref:Uncharacterized protein n=3 Tax=Mycolicibacterium smegmatis TaxID=1772 RepID=A0R335_MYCS2|nr:hypothetical protein [Mycolicibacterium smegmatis]ABK73046.1 hypothetical protein MSMEG_5327 [Mycolicibacterium smegmatis MC2 155]AFP41626.1 hypothetical protein MSMEI_5182 [Mycolicibacterium smegmatis MC2 155]AIU10354.1 hypothetical protein LJ00_26330 [Mycolicibacterium smegmatis MC2 155]AIU16979.1 hypothetical protein LI99_26335 [Mycolicibacterium smegmatis]AIU23602.1 hypothetical protein LI98_26340 [Mycolicibacterium smegmatis]
MSKHPVPSMPAVPCARAARRPHPVHRDRPPNIDGPVLITPQQVLFSTAAAAGRPTRRLGFLWRVASAPSRLVSRTRTWTAARRERHRPHVRLGFMEEAAMSREMDRL